MDRDLCYTVLRRSSTRLRQTRHGFVTATRRGSSEMLLLYAPAVVAALVVVLSPGLLWAWWRYPAPEPVTRVCVGVCVGFAYQIHSAALLAASLAWGGPGITTASVAITTAVGVLLALLLVWRTP